MQGWTSDACAITGASSLSSWLVPMGTAPLLASCVTPAQAELEGSAVAGMLRGVAMGVGGLAHQPLPLKLS